MAAAVGSQADIGIGGCGPGREPLPCTVILDFRSKGPGFESLGYRSVRVSRLTLALALEVGSPTRLRSPYIPQKFEARPMQIKYMLGLNTHKNKLSLCSYAPCTVTLHRAPWTVTCSVNRWRRQLFRFPDVGTGHPTQEDSGIVTLSEGPTAAQRHLRRRAMNRSSNWRPVARNGAGETQQTIVPELCPLRPPPPSQGWRNDSRGGGGGGLGLGGPRGKESLSDAKGPKPPIQLLQLLKNSPK